MLPVLIVVTVSWVYTFVNLSKLVKMFKYMQFRISKLYLNEAV